MVFKALCRGIFNKLVALHDKVEVVLCINAANYSFDRAKYKYDLHKGGLDLSKAALPISDLIYGREGCIVAMIAANLDPKNPQDYKKLDFEQLQIIEMFELVKQYSHDIGKPYAEDRGPFDLSSETLDLVYEPVVRKYIALKR